MTSAIMSHTSNNSLSHRTPKNIALIALLSASFGAVGCGAAEGEPLDADEAALAAEDEASFDSVESAFSQSDCADGQANATRTGLFGITTPQTYNTCYKGYVIDANDYEWSGCDGSGVYAEWEDTVPTTKAECEGSHIRMIVYTTKKADGTWDTASAIDQRLYGDWWAATEEFSASCNMPRLYQPMTRGNDYRIAVTARNTANSTRKVMVHGYMGCIY